MLAYRGNYYIFLYQKYNITANYFLGIQQDVIYLIRLVFNFSLKCLPLRTSFPIELINPYNTKAFLVCVTLEGRGQIVNGLYYRLCTYRITQYKQCGINENSIITINDVTGANYDAMTNKTDQ